MTVSAGSLRADPAQGWVVPHAWTPDARVVAQGSFDTESWVSTGITYAVDVDSIVPFDLVPKLSARVDEVAEIPQALRTGMSVERTHG